MELLEQAATDIVNIIVEFQRGEPTVDNAIRYSDGIKAIVARSATELDLAYEFLTNSLREIENGELD